MKSMHFDDWAKWKVNQIAFKTLDKTLLQLFGGGLVQNTLSGFFSVFGNLVFNGVYESLYLG